MVKNQTNLLAIPFHPWPTSDHLLRLPATTPRRQGPLASSYPEHHSNLDKLPPYALSYHHQEGKGKKKKNHHQQTSSTNTHVFSTRSITAIPSIDERTFTSLPFDNLLDSNPSNLHLCQNIRLLLLAIVFSCHFFLASIWPFSSLHCR